MGNPKIYLASPVFRQMAQNDLVSQDKREKISDLLNRIETCCDLIESDKRFPASAEIKEVVEREKIRIIGCHLSHTISQEIVSLKHLQAVCTATAGYNHIARKSQPESESGNGNGSGGANKHEHGSQIEGESKSPLIITHTPSILQQAVADFIISLILSAFKSIPTLNRFVWEGKWQADQKWDMDAFLGRSLASQTLGIIGLGEIGQAVAEKLAPWNMKILYSSRTRKSDMESLLPNLRYRDNPETIFKEADIVSLNVPLTPETRHMVNRKTLLSMKANALLINTARGEVVDSEALLTLLETKAIDIDLAFDVFDPEPIPIEVLSRFQRIATERPERQFIFIPHTASADADTRAEMVIMMLSDIESIAKRIQYLENSTDTDTRKSDRQTPPLLDESLANTIRLIPELRS